MYATPATKPTVTVNKSGKSLNHRIVIFHHIKKKTSAYIKANIKFT